MSTLEVITWGAGDAVMLVHGSQADGPATWAHQRPLSERWCLHVVQRRGFGASPAADGEDFERDADDLCRMLEQPTHIVAHSYGAIGALLAATRRPAAVRSLTVIEPTCVTAAMDDPEIAKAVEFLADWWLKPPTDPRKFLTEYSALIGVRAVGLDDGSRGLRDAARRLRSCRPPWTAEVPWDRLAAAQIPMLVVSGGHSPALDAVAAAIARMTGAGHTIIRGAGHAVQRAAETFNPKLERHMRSARHQATTGQIA